LKLKVIDIYHKYRELADLRFNSTKLANLAVTTKGVSNSKAIQVYQAVKYPGTVLNRIIEIQQSAIKYGQYPSVLVKQEQPLLRVLSSLNEHNILNPNFTGKFIEEIKRLIQNESVV